MRTLRRPLTKRNAPRPASTERVRNLFAVEKVIIHTRPVNAAFARGFRHVSEIVPAVLAQIVAFHGKASR